MKYYIVVEEWSYPNGIGRKIAGDYDTREDAMLECEKLANNEYTNFQEVCGDADYPQRFAQDGNIAVTEGWMLAPKNGLDEWSYQARIIAVENAL